MTDINSLTAVDALEIGDQFPIWDASSGDTRKASADVVAAYVADGLGLKTTDTHLASPGASGFVVTLSGTNSLRVIMTPAAAYAAGTIVLPTGAVDGQIVNVHTSQAVTALTVTGANAGAPTTLAQNGYFTLQYDGATALWRRIG